MTDELLLWVGIAGVLLLGTTFVVVVSRYERLLKKADKRFLDERRARYSLETELWVTKSLAGGRLSAALEHVEAIGRLVEDDDDLSIGFVRVRVEEAKTALKGRS